MIYLHAKVGLVQEPFFFLESEAYTLDTKDVTVITVTVLTLVKNGDINVDIYDLCFSGHCNGAFGFSNNQINVSQGIVCDFLAPPGNLFKLILPLDHNRSYPLNVKIQLLKCL